jgi:hypothetical protein
VTWTAVPDGPEFEIGGYLDTGEVLLAGGIADIAARGDGLVAAGKRCDELGESCEVALWTSSDGRSWGLQSDVTGFGALRAAAAGPGGFLALGSLCARSDCPPEGDRVAGYFSSDGVAWEAVDLAVPAPNQGVAAVTAGDVFAAVIATDSTPHVSVWASHDGRTWSEVPETLEIEGAVVIFDVTAIVLPLGTALIVGSAETDAPGPTTFVLRIPAQP